MFLKHYVFRNENTLCPWFRFLKYVSKYRYSKNEQSFIAWWFSTYTPLTVARVENYLHFFLCVSQNIDSFFFFFYPFCWVLCFKIVILSSDLGRLRFFVRFYQICLVVSSFKGDSSLLCKGPVRNWNKSCFHL